MTDPQWQDITEPSWLSAKVDQRIAFVDQQGGFDAAIEAGAVLAVFLSEPEDNAGPLEITRWEHTCDGCGKYLPNDLHGGRATRTYRGVIVEITFGCCKACSELP